LYSNVIKGHPSTMNAPLTYRLVRPVVLIGMPTCGKSTVGQAFGAHYAIPFNDSDALIATAAGKSISQMFADDGEAYFRAEEYATLQRLLAWPNTLIAAGGGAFAQENTRTLLLDKAYVVWLYVAMDCLLKRLTDSMVTGRPLSVSYTHLTLPTKA
jgi:shikimate kinase